MIFMHMLSSGGLPEAGALGAALVDAGAALLACSAELALARCAWPQDATCRTLCSAALRHAIHPSLSVFDFYSVHAQGIAAV